MSNLPLPVRDDLLRDLAAEAEEEKAAPGPTPSNYGQAGNGGYRHRLNVPRWLQARGVEFREKGQADSKGRTVWVLKRCPFDPSHGDPDSCIMQAPDGKLSAQCFHNSCRARGWQDFKQAIGKPDGDHYDPPMGATGESERARDETGGPKREGTQPPPPSPWPDPIAQATDLAVPAFPVDCLPDWLAEWVRAEARATQTPHDLPAVLALVMIGAGLATKFRVLVRPGWTEPTNTYGVVALPSGDRKSVVFSDAAPVEEFEQEEVARMAEEIAQAQADHRILEERLKAAEKKAAKEADANKRMVLTRAAKDLAKELAKHHVPEPPQFVCDDVTPEELGRLLARQGGRMLQAAAEGTAFEIAKGRYSETANFDVYLKGHAGDALRVHRVSRAPDIVPNPALSVALAVQPDVLRGLAEQVTMRGRGFLARWLYSVPRSRVGSRKVAPPAVAEDVARDYRDNMVALWKTTGAVDGHHKPTPHLLVFSPEADRLMREFEGWLEPQLAEGEDLSFLAGWASKLAGAAARLAGILHVATHAHTDQATKPISGDTAAAAIRLARDYFLPHAQAALSMMGANPKLDTARRVWATLCRRVLDSKYSQSAPLISAGATPTSGTAVSSPVGWTNWIPSSTSWNATTSSAPVPGRGNQAVATGARNTR
jgi:hypothetical protein